MTATPGAAVNSGYLLPELVTPAPEPNGLDTEYWAAIQDERLVVQRCRACGSWQWGPEWACYDCRSFDIGWEEVPKEDGRYRGKIYSWERVWHPTHDALVDAVPYVIVLVRLPAAGDIRMVGNLTGDQRAQVSIDADVHAVFEHHASFTLVQWERD